MPSEPDHKMDDLLKTYAKKRQDEAGAPMEMHLATRRLLQAEAAKLRPVNALASGSWRDALRIFWPRLAFAAGILLVAGLAAVTFLKPANEKQAVVSYAKQDAATPAVDGYVADEKAVESRLAPVPRPAKPESESVATLQDQISSPAPARRKMKTLPELVTVSEAEAVDVAKNEPRNNVVLNRAVNALPAATPAPVSEPVALGVVVAPSADNLGRVAGGPPAPATVSVDDKFKAVAGAKQIDDLTLRYKEEKPLARQKLNSVTARSRFANVQPVSRQSLSKATTAYDNTVLANFVVEQDGEQLRVVDADGSVYDGKVLFSEAATAGFEAQLKVAADVRRDADKPALAQSDKDLLAQQPQAGPVAAAAWNFRVSGTNRTLQQPVVVDGILFETAATNSLNQAGAKVADEPLLLYRFTPAQNSSASSLNQSYNGQSMNLLNTRRIQGSIRVGATNQLPLDAVPHGNQR